ncbi:hypothetical protein SLS57_010060 [Botryosphaeria dothidea]
MLSTFHRMLLAAAACVFFTIFLLRFSLKIEDAAPVLPETPEELFPVEIYNNQSVAVPLASVFEDPPTPEGWRFHPARDARNYGLSEEQCDWTFPNLWIEIEKAARVRRNKGNVTKEDLDINWRQEGVTRCMIYDHQLYILDTRGTTHRRDYRERTLAVLHNINRAVTAYNGPLPNIEFTFSVDDWVYDEENLNIDPVVWGFTRQQHWENVWLMPDFGYWAWPTDPVGAYQDVRNQMGVREKAQKFSEKKAKVVWRGAPLTEQRQALIKQWHGKPWSDIEPFDWDDPEIAKKFVIMPDHCQWQFVLHTEGRSYSGRLKYLQNCHSVPIIPELRWVEPHHQLLIPQGPATNYVPVKYDFSDLGEKMKYYLDHPDEAERIADNNVAMFRDKYLTPAAQACYWRKMFRMWRDVSFEPELSEDYGKPRGIPFETYVLLDIYDSNPWVDPEPPV